MHFDQLGILAFEGTVVAGLLLLLFHRRNDWGLTPLFVAMGVFQHMQAVLAISVYVEVSPGLIVSPGSVVLFTATLFAVLLVYINEGAIEARKLIYALVMANISVALLSYAAGLHVASSATVNEYKLPAEFFVSDLRVVVVGTICLFVDTVLVIVFYEALSHRRFGSFIRIFLTVTAVLCLDQFLFTTGAFLGTDGYRTRLFSGLIGKCCSGLFYATALWAYLKWRGNEPVQRPRGYSWDVFQLLSYRQKFDLLGQRYNVLEEHVQQRTVELRDSNRQLVSEIAEHRNTESVLREREQKLKSLSRQLIEAQETERRNLARELHDEIGQLLTVIKMQIRTVQRDGSEIDDLEQAVRTIDDTITQVRSLSLRLRPAILDDLGLVPALEWQAERIEKAGINVVFKAAQNLPRLESHLETVLFRVTQEALTNIMRHSEATKVYVELTQDSSRVELLVKDNGIGFDVVDVKNRNTTGLGLSGMRERVELVGGVLTLHSKAGEGTELSLTCRISDTLKTKRVKV